MFSIKNLLILFFYINSFQCPGPYYCGTAIDVRRHLSICLDIACKKKFCTFITQVISHSIHCMTADCRYCPEFKKKSDEQSIILYLVLEFSKFVLEVKKIKY